MTIRSLISWLDNDSHSRNLLAINHTSLDRSQLSLINAVRIRSVGGGVSKKLTGAILGQVYLISKEHMKSLYEAMLLRGYGNKVKVSKRLKLNKSDILHIGVCILFIVLFFILKGHI